MTWVVCRARNYADECSFDDTVKKNPSNRPKSPARANLIDNSPGLRFRRIDSGQKLPFSQSCERHDGHQVRQSPAFRGGNARSIRATAQNKARCDYPPQRAKFLPDRNFDNIVKNVRGQRKGDVRRGAPPFRVELAGDYQIRTRSPGARYMPSPALTPNAS